MFCPVIIGRRLPSYGPALAGCSRLSQHLVLLECHVRHQVDEQRVLQGAA